MSQTDDCQTPPTRRLPVDDLPSTKRSNERRLWHEQEVSTPLTPSRPSLEGGDGPKYSSKADRYNVDKSLEPDKKKLRTPPSKSGSKNRNRRSARHKITFLENSESDTLRSELSSVHKTYLGIIQDKDKEIATLKDNLVTISNLFAEDMDSLNMQVNDIQHDLDITEEELTISQKSEKEWTGRTLKLKFILDEIKKIGALPEDHKEWVDPMVEDIEIPEVSINIKDEFVPTAQTDNIDWVDTEDEDEDEEEEDIIGDYLENETTINRELDENGSMMNVFAPQIDYSWPRAILEKSATTIQKAWRNRQTLKKEQLDGELNDYFGTGFADYFTTEWPPIEPYSATKIQSIWRGYHLRKLLAVTANRSYPSWD